MAQAQVPESIRSAVDRLEIEEVMARYAAAVDARRWELLADVFVLGAVVDFRPNGGARDEYPDIVTYLETALAGFAAYQHYLTNFVTEVHRDEATSRFYVFTQMVTIVDGRDELMSDGGFYDARFVRTPAGWRVQELVAGLVWIDGEFPPDVPMPAWYGVSRDRYRAEPPPTP